MIRSIENRARLNNGVSMPWLGLGTYGIDTDGAAENAIGAALDAGYRLIDTAAMYNNEKPFGRALRTGDVPRGQLFVTTKLWNTDQGYDSALAAFDRSLLNLGLDYVDLYLIHWPIKEKSLESWRALERILADGRAKSIGVSNFTVAHLKTIIEHSGVVPAVNQVEFHPHLKQPHLQSFCREKGILLEAWSPIIKGRVNNIGEIISIAEKHGKSPAQVTLRWDLQKGVATIPKSSNPDRIRENAGIFDFELSTDEIKVIDELDRYERIGSDPEQVEF